VKPAEVIKFVKDNDVKMVDLRFVDWPGMWQHFSVPISELSEDSFEEGYGFDGSSIRGWQPINMSDMLVIPDASSAQIDPFYEHKTLVLVCDIQDPITREPYSRDPRYIARKAEAYLKQTGIGDTAYFGPEAEFFIFDDVRYQVDKNLAYHEIDSVEGHWNTARHEGPNLGYKIRKKEGYFPVPPSDTLQDIRTEMVLAMQSVGIRIEAQHHEVATAGQCEIDMRFTTLTKMADQLMWYKYIVKNVARRNGKTATFMPKPLFEDNGSGMHVHQSIWRNEKPLFAGDRYAGFSEMGLWYIGGILKHAPALVALACPTTNSYRRLVPGFEAPVNLAYSSRNRSAAVRIPVVSPSPKAKRLEFRSPDPSCNPYLTFAACLLAGIDGIQKKIDPGEPLDKDIYGLSPEELAHVPSLPGSLAESLNNLERDHEWLLRGDVFTPDAIRMWIDYKRDNELHAVSRCPHPKEFELYFDI
jgi:glutamine synthetase